MNADKDTVSLPVYMFATCRVCGEKRDLRFGSCHPCSDNVSGQQVMRGVHLLWETDNPSNKWLVNERL